MACELYIVGRLTPLFWPVTAAILAACTVLWPLALAAWLGGRGGGGSRSTTEDRDESLPAHGSRRDVLRAVWEAPPGSLLLALGTPWRLLP